MQNYLLQDGIAIMLHLSVDFLQSRRQRTEQYAGLQLSEDQWLVEIKMDGLQR